MTGIGVAIAGRLTPLIRPIRSSADAMVAPVLPAEIIAEALPSRTASAARTSVESFLRRTPPAGSSSIAMTSLAGISGRSPMSTREPRSSGPTRTLGMPAAAANLAPSTISPGERSPPMASTAIGSTEPARDRRSGVDVDGDAVLVPAARRAHRVRLLGVAAPRARAARRGVELPGAGATAAGLRLRLLLLRDGHSALRLGSRARTGYRSWRRSGRVSQSGQDPLGVMLGAYCTPSIRATLPSGSTTRPGRWVRSAVGPGRSGEARPGPPSGRRG